MVLYFLQIKFIFFKAFKICDSDLFFNLNCKNFIFFVFKTAFKIIKYFLMTVFLLEVQKEL